MNDQTLFDNIEAYLSNTMDQPSRLAFESSMEKDLELKAQVDAYRKTNDVIEYAWRKDIKSRLRTIDHEMTNSDQSQSIIRKVTPMWKKLAVAAAFILAIGSVGMLMQKNNSQANESWAESFITEIEDSYTKRGGMSNNSQENNLKSAILAYKSKKYYLAIDLFTKVLEGPASFTQQDAEWGLAVTYAELGKMEEFNALAKKIASDPNHQRQFEAQERLKD